MAEKPLNNLIQTAPERLAMMKEGYIMSRRMLDNADDLLATGAVSKTQIDALPGQVKQLAAFLRLNGVDPNTLK